MKRQTQHEQNRLAALYRYEILDSPADGSFNDITTLAAKVFDVPLAMIGFVDYERVWFKSAYGAEEMQQIVKASGYCSLAILSNGIYMVEDAEQDPRWTFTSTPGAEHSVRFYAAAPLRTPDGYNIGTFCIIDKKPRTLTSDHQQMLTQMAGIVMKEIELRYKTRTLVKEYQQNIRQLRSESKQADKLKNQIS